VRAEYASIHLSLPHRWRWRVFAERVPGIVTVDWRQAWGIGAVGWFSTFLGLPGSSCDRGQLVQATLPATAGHFTRSVPSGVGPH